MTSGTYSNVFNTSLDGTYSLAFLSANGGTAAGAQAALLTGLQAGEAYFNIRTVNFPAGEIRGFFKQVPVPGTLGLFLLGFSVFAVTVTRRSL